jgi:hypothetical protein
MFLVVESWCAKAPFSGEIGRENQISFKINKLQGVKLVCYDIVCKDINGKE